LYRGNAADEANLVEDARDRAAAGFEFLERELGGKTYLLGDDFSAADIMMGFTLVAAQQLGVLDGRFPRLTQYLARVLQRPALQRTIAIG
jgi:glutathione S-transferase